MQFPSLKGSEILSNDPKKPGKPCGCQTPGEEYNLLPTRRDSRQDLTDWMHPNNSKQPSRRMMTEGYINQRLPRNNTIGQNQAYITKVLENPKTPQCNRQAVVNYVLDHPDKFMALADQTQDNEFNEWARKKNGNARFGFLPDFRKKYLRR